MKTLLKNIQILHGKKLVSANILIEGKLIQKISEDKIPVDSLTNVIDGKNNIAIHGIIDVHVHFREPGLTHKEDFLSGSKAAASGGVTTILDMPNTNPATTTLKALGEKRQLAKKSLVNYGFHFGATKDNIDELIKSRDKNIRSVKIYMGSSTGNLLLKEQNYIEEIFRRWNGIITVHAEDECCLEENKGKFPLTAENHGNLRARECAVIAVKKAIFLAGKYRRHLHIAHISTKDEIALIREAKNSGINVTCEVTPHHLFLDESYMKKLGNYGKVNPPLRQKSDCEALWRELGKTIDIIATDHAPHTRDEKEKPYSEAPSGMPGVETTLALLMDAYSKKRIELQTIIKITSENPARIFGIKNKGLLLEGYDADLTIIDVRKTKEVRDSELNTKCKWSPFSGWKLKGLPVMTFVNGNLIYSNGTLLTENSAIEVDFYE